VLTGFDTATLVGTPNRVTLGPRGSISYRVSEDTSQALGKLARSHHTTVNTVLQAAWARMLMWLTGHHDVVFAPRFPGGHRGARRGIDGGPVDQHGAGARTHHTGHHTADLLDQLHSAHNHTFDHQHLALTEIHRATGHDQLFDTLFVFENYPLDTAALAGTDELAITEISAAKPTTTR